MMLASLFVASALTLPASAFLVVPEIDTDAVVPGGFHHFDAHDAHTQSINLKCAECPFAEVKDDGELSWSDSTPTYLALDFALDRDIFLLNGQEIPASSDSVSFQAIQYRQSDNLGSAPLDFGFALEMMAPIVATDGTESTLTSVRFTILDLGGIPVTMDTAILSVIRTGSGEMYFARSQIESSTAQPVPWKECRRQPQCLKALFLARVRAFLDAAKEGAKKASDKLAFTKGCNGKTKHHHGKPPHHHQGGHHGTGHHGKMHHGHFAHAFSQALHLIIVPGLLGVLAGLVAIATGMLAGQLIVFLWLRHRGQAPRSGPSAEEAGDDMEKEALIVDDLPPQYEDGDHGVIVLEADKA